ncbi:hypothetical protein G4B88_017980 [Cannabis sativa]|uniref:Purple acid phosphatase n=1 Tax=Cannabis sativa TaxID=3483 RepID=A0A7J6HKU1_CANSA|nr:hypothetical protein G4B88_017980 [Cannabis sativa]
MGLIIINKLGNMKRIILIIMVTLLSLSSSVWGHIVIPYEDQPLSKINILKTQLDLQGTATISAQPLQLYQKGRVEAELEAEWVTVSVKNSKPSNDDWFQYANHSSKNYVKSGEAKLKFLLINMRSDFSFALFSGGFSAPKLVSISDVLSVFANPKAPLYPRLAIGKSWDIMTVTWTSGYNIDEAVPFVEWGLKGETQLRSPAGTLTYDRNSMCGAPARTVGWHHPGFIHTSFLKDLWPNSQYSYRMGHRLVNGSYVWSKSYSFKSSPYPGQDSLQRVIIMGDMGKAERDGSNEYANSQPGSLNTTDQLIKDLKNYDILFHIGDMAYADGYLSEWDQFIAQVSPIASAVPYMVASGNHERDWPNSGSFWDTTDSGGECGVPAETLYYVPADNRAKFWYSADYGIEHDWRAGSEQYAWIEKCLASADRRKQPWLIFIAHRVLGYSSNYWYGQEGSFSEPEGREDLQKLWQKYKVDIAFFGHVHNYERICPIYQNQCVNDEKSHFSGVVNGTIHVVTGGGGKSLAKFSSLSPVWSVYRDYDWGFVKLTAFNHSSLLFEYKKSRDGERIMLILMVTLSLLSSVWGHIVIPYDEQPLSKINILKTQLDFQGTASISAKPLQLYQKGRMEVELEAEWITVTVKNSKPSNDDWVGVFSPGKFDSSSCPPKGPEDQELESPYICSAPIKFQYANYSSKDYVKTGKASLKFLLINMRSDFSFALFSGGYSAPKLVSVSNLLSVFANPKAPLYPRLALGKSWDEMTVTWTSGYNIDEAVPFVEWGLKGETQLRSPAGTLTYDRNSMCGAPARTVGWHHPGFIHTSFLKDLWPNSQYSYRMGHRLVNGSYVWSKSYSFKSSPYPGQDSLQRVIIMGDMGKAERDGSNEYANTQPGSLNTTDQLIRDLKNYDILFHIGDMAYADGYLSEWDQFIAQVSPISSAVPYMIASGNHERDWPNSGSFWDTTDSGGECDYGMFKFCVADSEHDWRAGSEQYAWIEKCLASADRRKQPWLIFIAHRVLGYSSNYWYGQEGSFSEPEGRDDLQKLWQKYKVDIAFFGHVHNYERICPIYQNQCVNDEKSHFSGVVNGTIHVVTGGGGKSLAKFSSLSPVWSVYRDYDWGFVKLTAFNHSSLLFEYKKSRDGEVYDSFTVYREYKDVLACVHDNILNRKFLTFIGYGDNYIKECTSLFKSKNYDHSLCLDFIQRFHKEEKHYSYTKQQALLDWFKKNIKTSISSLREKHIKRLQMFGLNLPFPITRKKL